ncbi:SCP-like extracellular protein [Caldicellulosiruptor hydrothermalis 108]|uniref:SCP-like extracellular protein n=1 Tax=Caldicellulosiruptor hydrothermalis (strain DSM 18901 / VKM B-2411 / 108) TaxID=632292 RepID=E4QAI5_CALH1|nr:CAP domain-containing protein [Caldicellulosiruptor hydrothermalis]ADQ08289.1 SCP-like extracellular protein [Caldicellulosiruptor hydrothermalis 108]
MFAKRCYLFRCCVLLLIALFIVYISIHPAGNNAVIAASQQKRNVYMFCSKSYFDKVYLGAEIQTFKSPFDFPFYVSKNPSDFFIAGFENDRLVFYYTNSKLFAGFSNIKIGSTVENVKKSKLSFMDRFVIIRGNSTYTYDDGNLRLNYDVAVVKNSYYVFLFYDRIAKPNVVCGIFMVKKSLWDEFLLSEHPISSKKDAMQSLLLSFEKIHLLHLNSIRSYLQKPYFIFSDSLSKLARMHSQSMAKYNYFSHTDISEKTPSDRFKDAGILFRKLGENIIMGTKLLPFFANHFLLNSKGHRQNIEESFEIVGVGCAVDPNYENVYYTQDFAVLLR